jgi:hypothetical protein
MKKIFTLLTILGLSVMGLKAQQVWTGATSTDWNVATNWLDGTVPQDTGRIQISTTYVTVDPITLLPNAPTPVTNFPSLSINTTVDNLTIDAGATLNLNGKTLTIFGKVAGAGQILGSATSGINAGAQGTVVYKLANQHAQQFSADPAKYFEDFQLLENPGSPGYGTIEFGNASRTFDVSAVSTLGEAFIVDDFGVPTSRVYLSVAELENGNSLILNMIGTEPVTSFSGMFGADDLASNPVNGHRLFNVIVRFVDGSTPFIRRDSTTLVGASTFIGFVSSKAISQIEIAPLQNNIYVTADDLTFGRRAPFGTLNTDVLGTLSVDLLSTDTLRFSTQVSIGQTLSPISGVIEANGNLKLLSSETGTARIANHTTASKINGNVTVERYIQGGVRNKQWRFLGFPYSGSLTLNNITGTAFDFNIPNSSAPSTIKYFDPALDNGIYGVGSTLGNAGYVSFTDINGQIQSGQGVATWLYGTSGTATAGNDLAPLTIVSSGLLNETGAAYTKTLGSTGAGWNLVANPYASTIDWDLGVVKTNVDPTVYRWDPEAVNWTTYNATTNSSTGNGSRYIESGAAFFVKKGADLVITPSLSFPQSAKVVNTGTSAHFTRNGKKLDIASQSIDNNVSSSLSGLRIKAVGTGNPIPSDIYLDLSKSDATAAYDNKYDAIAMGRSSGADVKFVGEKDKFAVQFDAPIKNPGAEKRYYPLAVSVPQQGAANIDIAVEGTWNSLNTVSLIDTKDNKTIPMVGGKLSYAFKMQDLKEEGRFLLAINHVAAKGTDNGNEVTVRVLNNPVRSETIQALISHPNAKAKNWSVLSASGSAMSTGQINPSDASVQHELRAGKLNSNGVYYLKVNFENGDSKTVRFVKL